MLLNCLLYFAAGLFADALLVMYYRAISGKKAGRAAVLSGVIAMYGVAVTGFLVKAWFLPYLLCDAAGNVAGTYWVLKWSDREVKV